MAMMPWLCVTVCTVQIFNKALTEMDDCKEGDRISCLRESLNYACLLCLHNQDIYISAFLSIILEEMLIF